MCIKNWKPLFFLAFLAFFFTNCAVNALRTSEEMPLIEIQINNSPQTLDDYVSTTAYVPCRARLLNHHKFAIGSTPPFTFPTNLPVVLQNRFNGLGGIIGLATSSGGTVTSSLNAIIPRDGTWYNFYIRGTTSSTRDKDAVLEMRENRITTDNIVLTRKALMVTASPPPTATPEVEMIISLQSHIDDYVTWSPTSAQLRLVNGATVGSAINVRLQNMTGAVGKVNFAASPLTPNATATAATLDLTLPQNGDWVNCYVAGKWGNASLTDKDAVIEIRQLPSNAVLGREGLMVRIRKNANTITADERNRFLNALLTVHASYDEYQKFMATHVGGSASNQAHGGAGFLPWHRAYILHLERLMQAADPDVAVHYWRFDQPAPNVFDDDFMGAPVPAGTGTGGFSTGFTGPNPLNSWTVSSFATGINRTMGFSPTSSSGVLSEAATLALGGAGDLYANFQIMEGNPHGSAHGSFGGWISNITTATRDPLFFMLHCNVDHLWA